MSQGINNDMAVSKTRRVVKNLRWWMLILFLLGVTVNYITRNSLGILAPELKSSLGITTEQYSWIVGAFQLAYTLSGGRFGTPLRSKSPCAAFHSV